jgi:hypothetical protein
MSDEPLDRLPDEVRVPLAEFGDVFGMLEDLLVDLRRSGRVAQAETLDSVLGRMSRWAWPLLGELDEGEGYDG